MAMQRGSALQWMRLAMAGSVLMALCAFLCLVRVPVLPVGAHGIWNCVWAYRLRVLVYFVPFALGLGLLIWAERRFKRGYRDDLWNDAELAGVRRLAEWKLWGWIGFGIAVLWIAAMFWLHSTRAAAVWYVLMMPGQTAQRIKKLIAPPVERSSGLLDWHNFGPLRSEHWGERGA